MKVQFKYGVQSYSGTLDDVTFMSMKSGTFSIARKWVKPRLSENNVTFGSYQTNLRDIWSASTSAWKTDLSNYTKGYNYAFSSGSVNATKYSIFIKSMFGMADVVGHSVDLATITINDIRSLLDEAKTIKAMCESGILPKVGDWATYDKTI